MAPVDRAASAVPIGTVMGGIVAGALAAVVLVAGAIFISEACNPASKSKLQDTTMSSTASMRNGETDQVSTLPPLGLIIGVTAALLYRQPRRSVPSHTGIKVIWLITTCL